MKIDNYEYLLKDLESISVEDKYIEFLKIIDPMLDRNLLNFHYIGRQLTDGYYPTLREFKEKLQKAL